VLGIRFRNSVRNKDMVGYRLRITVKVGIRNYGLVIGLGLEFLCSGVVLIFPVVSVPVLTGNRVQLLRIVELS